MLDYHIIKDYVSDHYAHFGTYPMEVETNTKVYTFDQYWAILDTAMKAKEEENVINSLHV